MVEATNAICQMLSKIISQWPRSTGQGWNLAKFYEQLHVPDDIMQNGAPKGSHSGPVEHNHIEMVKRPSKRTQKRRSCLDMQLSQRTYESFLINTAYERIQSLVGNKRDPTVIDAISIPKQSSRGCLKIKVKDTKKHTFYKPDSLKLECTTIQYMVDTYTKEFLEQKNQEPGKAYKMHLNYFSEIQTPSGIFRAHISYHQQSEWYDWVMIRC